MKNLLEKTRKINKAIQQSSGAQVDFHDLVRTLSEVMDSSVYLVSRRGKVLGAALFGESDLNGTAIQDGTAIPDEFNQEILKVDSTKANQESPDNSIMAEPLMAPFANNLMTIVPLSGGGERLGTLIFGTGSRSFTDEDLLLAEYGATVAGMEILRSRSDKIEEEVRKKAACQIAIGTLSFSEQEAVEHIFDELNGEEGLLVASKIADRVGITRSVIVNALRKLESAGVIESRSLGMKGTYIRVLNEYFLDELEKHRSR